MKKLMLFIEGTSFNTNPIYPFFCPRAYTPIKNAVSKINGLHEDYEVVLCTFRRHNIRIVRKAMAYYGVRYHRLEYRKKGENYADVVVRVKPDILIEDDCHSIGGEKEMCITNVPTDIKQTISLMVVREFDGIDNIQI